jgi:(p)ppGpp synthase/HD superfamily hydrolase
MPAVDHLQKLAAPVRRATERKRALLRSLRSIAALSRNFDPGFQLHGRIKSIVSISEKMAHNGLGAHQVLDIIGIRAITKHTQDCYRLVRRIHSEYSVLASEYDDYIAAPKANGYRSLHTTVISPCGFPVEIQVRTDTMHAICERGSAAHSQYKNDRRVVWTPVLFKNQIRLNSAVGEKRLAP